MNIQISPGEFLLNYFTTWPPAAVKTLIMAGLIIYLYSKGYRNFLFL